MPLRCFIIHFLLMCIFLTFVLISSFLLTHSFFLLFISFLFSFFIFPRSISFNFFFLCFHHPGHVDGGREAQLDGGHDVSEPAIGLGAAPMDADDVVERFVRQLLSGAACVTAFFYIRSQPALRMLSLIYCVFSARASLHFAVYYHTIIIKNLIYLI